MAMWQCRSTRHIPITVVRAERSPNYVNAYAVQSRLHMTGCNVLSRASVIGTPTIVIHSDAALAPGRAKQFASGVAHAKLHWVTPQGQIDFYDDLDLIASCASEVATFFGAQF